MRKKLTRLWHLGRRARGLALITAVGAAGCHTYVPVQTPVPGSTVRVQIPVVSAAADPNAPPQTVSLEGLVVESGDTLVLATTRRQEYGAFREVVQYDTLRLAEDQRYGVEAVEFSAGKSVMLGVGLAAGVGLIAIAAFNGGGGGGDTPIDGGPPPPQGAVVVSSSWVAGLLGLLGGGGSR